MISISDYAMETKCQGDFGVFPQNGEELSVNLEYVEAVNGIGRKDVWYNDNTPQLVSHANEVIQHLLVYKQENKTVLVTDYLSDEELIAAFYEGASNYGFVPYATVRDLDELSEPYSPRAMI